MSVTDGQPASDVTFNAAYVSKSSTADQQMVAKLDLNHSGSTQISDAQLQINTNVTNIAGNASDISDNASDIATKAETTDVRLGLAEQNEALLDNQIDTDFTVSNMILDPADGHGRVINYIGRRRNDAGERSSMGKISLIYELDAEIWVIADQEHSNELVLSNIDISTSATIGTVSYSTDTMAGTGYAGSIRFFTEKVFGQFL